MQPQTQEDLRAQIPPFGAALTTAIILSAIGWVGLILLFLLTVPTLGPRWLLFFLVTLAFSGMALPVIHYLHRRFPGKPGGDLGCDDPGSAAGWCICRCIVMASIR